MPGVGEERMGGVEMPSRKDDPDARLTIGYSIYRLPRSGLVQPSAFAPFVSAANDRPSPLLRAVSETQGTVNLTSPGQNEAS